MVFFRAILVVSFVVAWYVSDCSEATPLHLRRGPFMATAPRATSQHTKISTTTQRATPAEIPQQGTFDTTPQQSTPVHPQQPGRFDGSSQSATPTLAQPETSDTTAQPVPSSPQEPVYSGGTVKTPTSLSTPLQTEMNRRKEKCGCPPIGYVSVGAVWKLEVWPLDAFPAMIPTEESIVPTLSPNSTSSQTPSSTTKNPVLGAQRFVLKRPTGQERRAKRDCCRQVNGDEKNVQGQNIEENHGARNERDMNSGRKVAKVDDTTSIVLPNESPFDEYERSKRQCCGQLDGSQKPCCGHLNSQEEKQVKPKRDTNEMPDPERKKRNCCRQANGEDPKPCCGQIDQDGKHDHSMTDGKPQSKVRLARQTSEYDQSVTPFGLFFLQDYRMFGCCGVQEGTTLDCCALSSKDQMANCCFEKFLGDFQSSLDEIYQETLSSKEEFPGQDITTVPLYPSFDYITE